MDERADDMVHMYESGVTMQVIGKKYGISRERVRQILAANGVRGRYGVAKRAQKRLQDRIDAFWHGKGRIVAAHRREIEEFIGSTLNPRATQWGIALVDEDMVQLSIHRVISGLHKPNGDRSAYFNISAARDRHHVIPCGDIVVVLKSKRIAKNSHSIYVPVGAASGYTNENDYFKVTVL